MKIRKLLSAFLAALMTMTTMSFVAFAAGDEAELSADLATMVIQIDNTGAGDQRCTRKDGVLDMMGRSVQQIIPNATSKPTANMCPAWISDGTEQGKMQAAGNGYKYIKFVYYTSHAAAAKPTLTVFRNNSGNWSGTGKSISPVVGDTAAQAGKWSTAIFEFPEGYHTSDFVFGVMFSVFGSDQVQNHLDETVYIGYAALYDTLEKAKVIDNDFEGDIVLSAINADGTAIAGFNAATTTYTVDLAGKDYVPEITVTGKGNANNLKIETSAYNQTTGTATATITADETVYTVNFTGGAVATNVTPVEIKVTTAGNDQGCLAGTLKNDAVETFGRTVQQVFPGGTNRLAPATIIYNNGPYVAARKPEYKAIKFVYYTSTQAKPTNLSLWADPNNNNGMSGRTAVPLHADSYTNPNGGWSVAYYDLSLSNFAENEFMYAYMFPIFSSDAGNLHTNDTVYIGYVGVFGSVVDAKNHKSIFEGDLNITEVKVGDTALTFTGGVATVDAAGAAKVPELTVTATGNTNNLVVTNGKFDTNGNAASTIANGDEVLYTVNFTGGQARELVPIIPDFEWTGARDQGIAGVTEITDEFSRTYKQYAPALTYFENGSDLEPKAAVSPGGNILTSALPEGMVRNDYTIMKVVYKTPLDYIPRLNRYTHKLVDGATKHTSIGIVDAQYVNAPKKDKWNVVYFDIPQEFSYYQFYFTSDACTNHIGELFEIGYAGLFGDLDDAKAHKSVYEGEFTITDVLLDGASIGKVETYTKDLAGAGTLPRLTVVATGDAEGVTVTNGVIGADGKATSTVTKDGTALVTVNFTGASTAFKVIDLLVDGKSIEGFDIATTEYTMDLGFGAAEPVVTYAFQGEEKTLAVTTEATVENNLTIKYVTTIKDGDTTLYTITFNVDTNKPEMLLNTLYKLNNEKKLTVAYLGGSVTSGTGSTNSNTKSWRGITRDWFKSTFPSATVTEINGAIGGTGAVFGVFRNQKQILDTAAGTPDLLFIETVTNDSYDSTYTDKSYIRYTESIIKQTLQQNPKCDIILIVTGDSGTFSRDAGSTTPIFGQGYGYLADRYNIPVVYVGFELAHQIKDDYGAGHFSTSSAGWKYYFERSGGSIDGVHPNDNGYAHYAKTIIEQCLTPNLPTTYIPTANDYAVKTNPAGSYSEENNLGSIMLDADMFNPADLAGDPYRGNFNFSAGSGLHGNFAKSYLEGEVISLEFNSSNLGIWTWSYGTENGKNGTDMLVSIDGGEPKLVNVYRSYPNHKVYWLAKDLDNTKTHTVRIYHCDSANPIDIRWFLMWGMPEGQAPSIKTVPYFNFETEEYQIKLGDEVFADFDPDVKNYEIPAQITAGQSYPTLEFVVRDNFYGYSVEQADGDSNAATLSVDNVGVYTFEFVNDTAIEVAGTANSDLGEANGAVEFAQAAEYKLQVKNDEADWEDATEYAAGTTKVEGLAPGKYNVRYIVEDGVYGFTKNFTIWTNFPYENIYYVTKGGSGDGTSAEKAAAVGATKDILEKAAAFFGDKAKTETCYIILVGDVVHDSVAGVDLKLFKDVVIIPEFDALYHIQQSVDFVKVVESSGKITFNNINVKLGNPAAAQSKINSEIMFHFFGNEAEFNNMKITDWAVNAFGEKRTSGICFDYYHDGDSNVDKGLGRPLTINCPDLKIDAIRLTGWGSGDEEGNATFILENVNFNGALKLGGHTNKETDKGVIKAYLEDGLVKTVLVSGDAATIQIGTVAFIHNGGTVTEAKVTSNDDTDETQVDRVAIFNNGTKAGTLTKDKIDYILHGAVGGSADITADDTTYRLTGFTFTTDKDYVIINKGEENEIKLTAENGTASIAVTDLAAGEYTVTYEDYQLPEGIVEVKAEISLGREPGTVPASGNHLVVKIIDKASGNVLKTIDLEDAATETDDNGCLVLDMQIDTSDVAGTELEIVAVKNGYAPYRLTTTADGLEEAIGTFFAGMEEGFEAGHGDIKGSLDAECGDGLVDIDDFIRVLRGFDPENSENTELCNALDLNEDGGISVQDLAIIKANFGFNANK